MNSKIEMASTHRLSLLFIILISGFKLGIAAPADGTKGTKTLNRKKTLWLRELKVLPPRAARDEKTFFILVKCFSWLKTVEKSTSLSKETANAFAIVHETRWEFALKKFAAAQDWGALWSDVKQMVVNFLVKNLENLFAKCWRQAPVNIPWSLNRSENEKNTFPISTSPSPKNES